MEILGEPRGRKVFDQKRLEDELRSSPDLPGFMPTDMLELEDVKIYSDADEILEQYSKVLFPRKPVCHDNAPLQMPLRSAREVASISGSIVPSFPLYCYILEKLYVCDETNLLTELLACNVAVDTLVSTYAVPTVKDVLRCDINHYNAPKITSLYRTNGPESLKESIDRNSAWWMRMTGLDDPFVLEFHELYPMRPIGCQVDDNMRDAMPNIHADKDRSFFTLTNNLTSLYPVKVVK